MEYKTMAQNGPDWLPKAVVCKVWDYKKELFRIENIVSRTNRWFKDTNGGAWINAEPTEEWEPKEGERVIAWNDDLGSMIIGFYTGGDLYRHCVDGYRFLQHIARLKNPDGSMVDLDCTIEELKQRTEWK